MGLYSDWIFPRILEWGLGSSEHRQLRTSVLESATGEVLEIGFGTGLNLPHYPETITRLTAIDRELMLPERVEERINHSRIPVERLQLDASGRLPFENSSFDSVVTTWTLCSISDVEGALSEIRRVLRPTGKYIFLEHGRSDNPRASRIQDLLNPIHRIIGRGCNINRVIDHLISGAGMTISNLNRFVMPKTPRIFGEMYSGTAGKR